MTEFLLYTSPDGKNESPRRKQRGISMKFNKRGKPRSIRLKKNKSRGIFA